MTSQARAVVQSSGSQTSLSIRSYLGNLKGSGHSQGPARIRNSDQGSWKYGCFKMLSRDSVAQPAHLTSPLDEQRGFLLTLQSDDPPKADILRLEGTCCRTRQQDPGRRWGFSKAFPQSESRSVVSLTGVGSLSLLQGIFPTQGSNPGLLHCRWILEQLSHKGSPRVLEWVAYPFSRGSSQLGNRTRVSYIAG